MTTKKSGLDTAAKNAAYSTNVYVQEAANLGDWVYARTHTDMVMRVDDMLAGDRLTADEYKAALEAVEMAMATFRGVLGSKAPQVFLRGPWEDASLRQVETSESASLANDAPFLGDAVELLETVVRKDGSIPIKIIQPGWGSSGYYPAEVLERDGPKVFAKGMHMYWDHPTEREEMERPERELDDLAAVLMSNARWQENGPKGPGLYADALVMEHYRGKVESLAPHIGVSIRAFGTAKPGEAEGRQGAVIDSLTAGQSVDFVTVAGAGGEILDLFESARRRAGSSAATSGDVSIQNPYEEVANMDELQKLQEANAALQKQLDEANSLAARSQEALVLREAREIINAVLVKTDLPAITRTRLAETLVKTVPVTEGALDKAALEGQIAEAVKAEVKYLAEAAGLGRIRGMGSNGDDPETDEEEASDADLVEAFVEMGLSESGAKLAAAGRK